MWGRKRDPGFQTFAHVSDFTHFLCKSQFSGYLSMYYGLRNVRDKCLNNGGLCGASHRQEEERSKEKRKDPEERDNVGRKEEVGTVV